MRFVVSVAKKFQNRGVPLVDLIGEGNLGLMTAARKFDPDRGVKFISYAVWWIRQAVQAAIARHGRPVRVPLNRTADLSRLGRTTTLLKDRLGRMPTTEELARATGRSRDLPVWPRGRSAGPARVPLRYGLRFCTRVRIGPSLAKVPLDLALTLTALRAALAARYDAIHSHEEGGAIGIVLSAAARDPPPLRHALEPAAAALELCAYSRSRVLRWISRRIERAAVRHSKVVIVICPELRRIVRRH